MMHMGGCGDAIMYCVVRNAVAHVSTLPHMLSTRSHKQHT